MKKLREQLIGYGDDFNLNRDAVNLARIAVQMDALLDECAKALYGVQACCGCHVGMDMSEKLEKAGYGATLGITVEGE